MIKQNIDLLNEINNDETKNIQEFLLQTKSDILVYHDKKLAVIQSIRHRMFTKVFPNILSN